jgi:hypothetical protein
MIGDSREAITSAGSITTRLLGAFPHVEHVIVVSSISLFRLIISEFQVGVAGGM